MDKQEKERTSVSIRLIMDNALSQWLVADGSISSRAVRVRVAMRDLRPRTIREIAAMTATSVAVAAAGVRELVDCGWLVCDSDVRTRPRKVAAAFPEVVEKHMVKEIRLAFDVAPFQGEWLMRAKLDLHVATAEYYDNCRPRWLRNVVTGMKMECDRMYPEVKVVFEYQGASHHPPAVPGGGRCDEVTHRERLKAYQEQVERDAQKLLACKRHGFELVEVTALELCQAGCQFLPQHVELPKSRYATLPASASPLARELDALADGYAKMVAAR